MCTVTAHLSTQGRGLSPRFPTWIAILLVWFAHIHPIRAEGYFSAKNVINGEPRLILDVFGSPLAAQAGRVEILDGTTILATGAFSKDGLFFLGTVFDPLPGGIVQLTVRAWDTNWGTTYADAKRNSVGYGLTTVTVSLSTGTTPPAQLDTFNSFKLTHDSYLGSEPAQFIASNRIQGSRRLIQDGAGNPLPAAYGRVELLADGRSVLSRPLTEDGGFDFGTVTADHSLAGTVGTVTLRAWDTRTGTAYVNATSRAEESFPAYFGLGMPFIVGSAPELVRMPPLTLRDGQPVIPPATFSASNVGIQPAVWVVDFAGKPYPKANGRVELIWKDAVVASGALSVDGAFDLGRFALAGTAPGEVVDLILRGWDKGVSGKDTFDSALVRGINTFAVRVTAADTVPAGGPVQFTGLQLRRSVQSLKFGPLADLTEGEPPLRLVATASSGLPVTFKVNSGPARLSPDGILQLLSPGRVTVTASQAGNAYYEPVSVTQSFVIVPAPRDARMAATSKGWQFSFRGDAGRTHLIESSATVQGPWKEVARAVGNDLDHAVGVLLPAPSEAVQFYRVRLP